MPTERPHRLLLIENNPDDVNLIKDVVHELRATVDIDHAPDAATAFALLARRGRFERTPVPDLIVLDLLLPGIDGVEVLRLLRRSDEWRDLPVAVLTSVGDPEVHQRCREVGAATTWQKPTNWPAYVALVRHLISCVEQPDAIEDDLDDR